MPNNTELIIKVCGPRDDPLLGTLKLSVASHAPAINPPGWKDLWKLSPFSHVAGGVQVPGLPGVRSKTIENAWQFLKVWDGSEGWDRETALAAFDSDCAMPEIRMIWPGEGLIIPAKHKHVLDTYNSRDASSVFLSIGDLFDMDCPCLKSQPAL